jgi:hypothetical protein
MGVSSTGKTTLSGKIRDLLVYPYIHEPLQEAFNWCDTNGLSTSVRDPRQFTTEDKVKFEKGMYGAQLEAEFYIGNFVADSALLNHAAYMMYFCCPVQPVNDTVEMYEAAMEHVKNYNAIFYLPFGRLPIHDDDRRLTNPHLLKTMDWIMQGLIKAALGRGNRNIYTVGDIILENRVKTVMNILSVKGLLK